MENLQTKNTLILRTNRRFVDSKDAGVLTLDAQTSPFESRPAKCFGDPPQDEVFSMVCETML